jgi:hypothetical protein
MAAVQAEIRGHPVGIQRLGARRKSSLETFKAPGDVFKRPGIDFKRLAGACDSPAIDFKGPEAVCNPPAIDFKRPEVVCDSLAIDFKPSAIDFERVGESFRWLETRYG